MQSCLNYNLSIDINNPHANKTQILSCFRKKYSRIIYTKHRFIMNLQLSNIIRKLSKCYTILAPNSKVISSKFQHFQHYSVLNNLHIHSTLFNYNHSTLQESHLDPCYLHQLYAFLCLATAADIFP